MDTLTLLGLAMAPPAGDGAGQAQSPIFMFGWIAIMIALFYFMMIRPQQKRAKQRQALLDSVKTGDRIVFSGGMMGVVTNVKDKSVMVKIADNVKVEILRGAVSQVVAKGDEPEMDEKA